MFRHVKQLQYTVRVAEPNPGLANLLPEQFGGPQGELAVDGGDGDAQITLSKEQAALLKAMAKRTESDPKADPLTGAELGAGKNKT